ncbi:FAD-dependent oxidoreductase [Bradyrhizobium sp. dw_411]|uniref:FAD-dependent oxidoreductase n=1 Tax=Bradyrhizobium sp. dw_411 TaxID=2720082 RepID=UPI001BCABC1F
MTRRKIVICGGGIAGLTAAFELTRPEVRDAYDVTIYQLGWRAGGKLASGRDDRGRNIEHGLHIWFGFYENAFGLLREVYDEWMPRKGQRIRTIDKAIRAQEFTPIGNSDGRVPDPIDITFPPTDGEPGHGDVDLSLLSCLYNCLNLLAGLYENTLRVSKRLKSIEPRVTIDRKTLGMLHRNRRRFDSAALISEEMTAGRYLGITADWLAGIDEDRTWLDSDDIGVVTKAMRDISSAVNNVDHAGNLDGKLLAETLELGAAFFTGVVEDILLGQRAISEIDGEDFRHWLVRHGATPSVAAHSPIIKALYDTMFQYPDGKIANASYGAGTAVQVVLRMLGTYRGALAWELQAGAGEVVIAPLFEVLEARGVKFQFFHKLAGVQVASDGVTIESLRFDRQVRLRNPNEKYDPLQMSGGLTGWGSAPNWNLIENGKILEKRKVDLESHWCNEKVETVQIEHIRDFDDVVLAVPLGAFKEFGSGGPCSELLTSNPRFKSMTQKLQLVPSISVQLWTNVKLAELGWTAPKPALVSGPEPLDIWADMDQLLVGEIPIGRAPAKSLQYLCDVFPSQLYQAPRTQSGVQKKAQQQAISLTVNWLTTKAKAFWPKFSWKVLYAPAALKGQDRLSAQIVRANINPSDCCVATSAGSSAWRLKTDQSGFDNLYLAGAWIDTGFNTECVEAAVMSGMQAARAITGEDKTIPGETFLHAPREYLGPCDLLRRYAFSELQDIGG